MAPKSNEPPSPKSLVWAHQMQREHRHIVERLQQLETAIGQIRIHAVHTSEKNTVLANLTRTTQAYADSAVRENTEAFEVAIDEVRHDVSSRLEEVDRRIETLIVKLDQVDSEAKDAESKKNELYQRETDLLKEVRNFEIGLDKYREYLSELGRKLEEASLPSLHEQIRKLVQDGKDAGDDRKRFEQSLTSLTNTGKAMDEQIREIRKEVWELRELRMENAMAEGAARPTTDLEQELTPDTAEELESESEPGPTTGPLQAEPVPSSIFTALGLREKGVTARKEADDSVPGTIPEGVASSSKQTGVDRIEARDSAPGLSSSGAFGSDARVLGASGSDPYNKQMRPLHRCHQDKQNARANLEVSEDEERAVQANEDATIAAADERDIDPQSQKPIVRKGKGWFEIDEGASLPGPGRARKRATEDTEEAPDQHAARPAAKRRRIDQDATVQAPTVTGSASNTRKRKAADADIIEQNVDVTAPRITRSRAAASATAPVAKKLDQETKTAKTPATGGRKGKGKGKVDPEPESEVEFAPQQNRQQEQQPERQPAKLKATASKARKGKGKAKAEEDDGQSTITKVSTTLPADVTQTGPSPPAGLREASEETSALPTTTGPEAGPVRRKRTIEQMDDDSLVDAGNRLAWLVSEGDIDQ